MKQKNYENIDEYVRDVMNYFRSLKKERELTKEEERLMLRGLTVRITIRSLESKRIEKVENTRQRNREKKRDEMFKNSTIVYEGVVDDIYEPVYATDYKDLKKKLSKYANFYPKESDFAIVKTYENGLLIKEEKWVRNNTKIEEKWAFGQWNY